MRPFNNLLLVLALLVVFSSCKKLDRFPLDKISSATFWKEKGDFDKALTAIYAAMQPANQGYNVTAIWSFGIPNWACITDNAYGQHNYQNTIGIASGDISPSTGGYISTVYGLAYQAIARINIFLDHLSSYQGADMTEEDRSEMQAEALFFRGFFYFQLYYLYGDVPLVVQPLSLQDQYQPKVPADEILSQIIQDVDFAIAHLPGVSYAENNGHLVATSAQALKARVLLYAAYGNNGTPDAELLKQVRDLCVQIESHYSLSPEFTDLFQTAGQVGNEEIIFSVNFLAPDNVAQWDLWYGSWLVVSPLQNFVDAFECTDGLPIDESDQYDPDHPFENRDPRLKMTVFQDYVDWGGGSEWHPSNDRPTGYGVKKFLDPNNLPYDYSTQSQQNAVIFRLGEVLLMHAEAENELSGPTPAVYQAIQSLRRRVHMKLLPDGLSKSQMRERIRHERRIELAFEGLRYYDLKRWHIAEAVLNNVKDGLLKYSFEEKFYKWPLPLSEIDKSHGVLVQNPDYQ